VPGRSARSGWAVPAAALLLFVWTELLRVWLPSIRSVVGGTGSSPTVAVGVVVLAALALPLAVAAAIDRLTVRRVWLTGGLLLAAARFAILLSPDGATQVAIATVGIIGGAVAVVALAAGSPAGHAARVGLLLGLLASVIAHAAFHTRDLVWDERLGARLGSLTLVVALLATTALLAREQRRDQELATADELPPVGAAWPWLVLAPTLLLVLIISGVPGRIAVAAPGWSATGVVTTIALTHGLAGIAALLAPGLGSVVAGATGSGLVLIGTAGALQAAGAVGIVGQAATAIGLGAIVGSLAATPGRSGPRSRALAAGAAIWLFGLLTWAYYAAYELRLPFHNRTFLLLGALLAAALGAAAGLSGLAGMIRPRIGRGPLLRLSAALVLVTSLAAGSVRGTTPTPTTSDAAEVSVRVAVHNVRLGSDPSGRFSARELAEDLRAQRPDVVVLNEVDRGWLTTGGHDVLDLLATELGLAYRFAPAADEVWGDALLSRYPVTEWSSERLPRGDDPRARSQFAAVLQVSAEQDLAVVGTQLSGGEGLADTRLLQARAVAANAARLRGRSLPTVVLGELEATREGTELAAFAALGLTSVLDEGAAAWPSSAVARRTSYILISPDLQAGEVDLPPATTSDRLPLVATLRWG
jgi:endonuclease/exonuclease/phosphatase family metal-dependent hydrolase